MTTEKISPLGKREGIGTYDSFYDHGKYSSLNEAIKNKDYVIVDFIKDENGVIYFEIYHSKNEGCKKHHRLTYQNFPYGVDVADDRACCQIAGEFLKDVSEKNTI